MWGLSAVRHFFVYRLETGLIVVGWLLHDAMDLVRHLDCEAAWQWSPAGAVR